MPAGIVAVLHRKRPNFLRTDNFSRRANFHYAGVQIFALCRSIFINWRHLHRKGRIEHADSAAILQSQVAECEPKLKEMDARNYRKYIWQKIFLVAGLASLLIARLVNQTKGLYW